MYAFQAVGRVLSVSIRYRSSLKYAEEVQRDVAERGIAAINVSFSESVPLVN